jgi:hypothetical protein
MRIAKYREDGLLSRRGWLVVVLAITLAWVATAPVLQAGRPDQDPIILIPGETVYVEVIQNTITTQPGFSWSDSGLSDRFHKFSQALEDAFEAREVPLKIKVVRWGSRIPKGATTATLTLMRWDRNRSGEIETRVAAQLKKAGSKINLGVFVGTDNVVTASSSMAERSYQASAVKAASRFADRMNEQINF